MSTHQLPPICNLLPVLLLVQLSGTHCLELGCGQVPLLLLLLLLGEAVVVVVAAVAREVVVVVAQGHLL